MTIAYNPADGDFDEVEIKDYSSADYRVWIDKQTKYATEKEKNDYIKNNMLFVFNKVNVKNLLNMIDDLSNIVYFKEEQNRAEFLNPNKDLAKKIYEAVSQYSISAKDALDVYYDFISNWKLEDEIIYSSFIIDEWVETTNLKFLLEDVYAYPVDLKIKKGIPSSNVDDLLSKSILSMKDEVKNMNEILEVLNDRFGIATLSDLEGKIERFKKAEELIEDCIGYNFK